MIELDEQYREQLENIAAHIQASDVLGRYSEGPSDEEEEEGTSDYDEDLLYKTLCDSYEPYLAQLHAAVAAESPLQLVALERAMLDDQLEALFVPRILGYSVLRNEVNDQYRYIRPNDHFKTVLLHICRSVHFEQLKKRIGQSIRVGFALSSDIWTTNLMANIENRRIRNYLNAQRSELILRDTQSRKELFERYKQQFHDDSFYAADFPSNLGELKANFSELRIFLLKRFSMKGDNTSLNERMKNFMNNNTFHGADEYYQFLALYGNFMAKTPSDIAEFSAHFERERKANADFGKRYLEILSELYKSDVHLEAEEDLRMNSIVDKKINDRISDYYRIIAKVHELGYIHPDTIESVKEFYDTRKGTAIETDCLRSVILRYFTRLLSGLTEAEYLEFFELSKVFAVYMQIFGNEQFNFSVEKISLDYLKKLLAKFTDKRSREYQDTKKFVASQYVNMGFLTEKEIVEMFKTRRRRKKTEEE